MFLQNILQQRLKSLNEEEQRYLYSAGTDKREVLSGTGRSIMGDTAGFNKTAKTIGSIRNKQINFSSEHKFFNQDQHMRPKAQKIRAIVQDEIDKDLLGTKKDRWNTSVSGPKAFNETKDLSEGQKKFLMRKGFMDETYTRTDPQTTYAGVDTRDVYYHGWDVTVEKTPPRDKERQYQMERNYLMDKTMTVADKLLKHKDNEITTYGIQTQAYINPETITKKINTKLRMEKEEEMQIWDQLLKKARYEFPSASENKLHAIVFKQVQEIKSGRGTNDEDPELTLKPDISASQASKAPLPQKPKRKLGGRGGLTNAGMSSSGNSKSVTQEPLQVPDDKDSSDSD